MRSSREARAGTPKNEGAEEEPEGQGSCGSEPRRGAGRAWILTFRALSATHPSL